MDRKRTILAVVITLFVVAALIAVGFAIYRLGYVHGTRSSATGWMPGAMLQDFRERMPQDFGGRFPEQLPRPDLLWHDRYMPMRTGTGFGFIPGFLLFIGVFTLVILAINSFNRQGQTVNTHDAPQSENEASTKASRNK